MKIRMEDDVDVNVHHDHDFDKQDVEDLIDKVVEGAVVIIAASTVSHILRRLIK